MFGDLRVSFTRSVRAGVALLAAIVVPCSHAATAEAQSAAGQHQLSAFELPSANGLPGQLR
jgi:hypothetical protein